LIYYLILADAAAESEEKKIESEQESTVGFIDIMNKKKESVLPAS